jgi:folate-binding protein YgfZ
MAKLAHLPARAVLAVTGEDRTAFLNGLVSNDMAEAAPGRCVWAALLTPQGKWLADFFAHADADRLLLDVDAAQAVMIAQRLLRFRLRARVAIEPLAWSVHAAWDGAAPPTGAVAAPDPRLPQAGWRILSPDPLAATASEAEWDAHRLALGLPDGARDMEPEKSVLLEAGFDELHGISWTKGCYMGQELTARTRYRGLVKRRLVQVRSQAGLPPPATPILSEGREVGQMRSSRDGIGLAILRLDALGAALEAGGAPLLASLPRWAQNPAKHEEELP